MTLEPNSPIYSNVYQPQPRNHGIYSLEFHCCPWLFEKCTQLQAIAVMADIRAEPAVEISFVLLIIQVNHLGQYNCIQTNASLG